MNNNMIDNMKKGIVFSLLMAASQPLWAEQVVVQTKGMTMVLDVENGRQPQYVYFGQRLADGDLQRLQRPRNGRMDAYPAYGMNTPAEAALAMRHADGNLSTELVVATGTERMVADGNETTVVHLKDPVYPVTVDLYYKAYNDVDMIETWTEIKNGEAKTVTLTQFA